ncbi:hypothetical protein [Aquiflexum gelatinilyticum]|uniref:Uncharacterized protein n=1 Tax=Aquiflexum gelatinilyticum TaxID=2961943 RepID=A0A9X2T233_9BACT|nr:hypothetical protein [Aquiflexum gelatinilyticum]MCR9016431.1 hypothetical protein [Aquiflexum gelatinilyticum]
MDNTHEYNKLAKEIYNSLENKNGLIWEFTLAIRAHYYNLFSKFKPSYFNEYSFQTHEIKLEDIHLQNCKNDTVEFIINGSIYDSVSDEIIHSNKHFLFKARRGDDIPGNEKFDFLSNIELTPQTS